MREVLVANDGMMLTNGKTYGREIYLADGARPDDFYEIAIAEYEDMKAAEENYNMLDENEDMKAALKVLGVE